MQNLSLRTIRWVLFEKVQRAVGHKQGKIGFRFVEHMPRVMLRQLTLLLVLKNYVWFQMDSCKLRQVWAAMEPSFAKASDGQVGPWYYLFHYVNTGTFHIYRIRDLFVVISQTHSQNSTPGHSLPTYQIPANLRL